MKLTIKAEVSSIDNRLEAFKRAVYPVIKAEVANGCRGFVPVDTGALSRSADASAAAADECLVYDLPYAKAQYYGAGGQWFEKWKGSASVQALAEKAAKGVRF